MPNFLNLRLANSHLKYLSTYRLCQLNLLREEIRLKKSTLEVYGSCQHSFLQNHKILKPKSSVQQKKFHKLLQESKTESDLEKVIFKFSNYVLSDIEKKLLVKGLNFCLPPKQLKYADYLGQFEFFYTDISNLEILSNQDLDFIETKTKETALSPFRYTRKIHNKIFLKKNLQLYQISVKTSIS